MLINERLYNLLKDVEYDTFYVLKPDGLELDTYITFDTTVKDEWFSNDGIEVSTYMVTINIITKDLEVMPVIIEQMKKIVNDDPNCCYFMNRGNTYIKDTREFFSACTFFMYVFPDE